MSIQRCIFKGKETRDYIQGHLLLKIVMRGAYGGKT